MTADEWLKRTEKALSEAEIETARLDALVLLEDATGKDRTYLLAHPELEIEPKLLSRLGSQVKQRAAHEPLAYIRAKQEFYGRDFMVNRDVMVPRPESETMINLLKKTVSGAQVIVDVGTGSGALAITAKLEMPSSKVFAIDISEDCIRLASDNATKLLADVEFIRSDLLEKIKFPVDVLLCNLPYVPDDYEINQAAKHEPKLALFGGIDGLDLYRQLFTQLADTKPAYIFTECLAFQHSALTEFAMQNGYNLERTEDLIQQFSYVTKETTKV